MTPKPKHTPGPWQWEVYPKSPRIELNSLKNGDSILRARRWGMSGAMIEFVKNGLFEHIKMFLKPLPRRDHHADWIQTVDHPDAHLIAASPQLLDALLAWKAADEFAQQQAVTGWDDVDYELHAEMKRKAIELTAAALAKVEGPIQ